LKNWHPPYFKSLDLKSKNKLDHSNHKLQHKSLSSMHCVRNWVVIIALLVFTNTAIIKIHDSSSVIVCNKELHLFALHSAQVTKKNG